LDFSNYNLLVIKTQTAVRVTASLKIFKIDSRVIILLQLHGLDKNHSGGKPGAEDVSHRNCCTAPIALVLKHHGHGGVYLVPEKFVVLVKVSYH